MKHFKHLKPGMSLIEVIAAIAILAIFGSSLFLMQQFLFDRMMITQRKLIANLRMQSELIIYQTNILKELLAQDGPIEKSLKEQDKNFTQPDMNIQINTASDLGATADEKNNPFKKFKNLHLIRAQSSLVKATEGKPADDTTDTKNEYGKLYLFAYIPEVAKK